MQMLLFLIGCVVAAYVVVVLLMPKWLGSGRNYTQKALSRLERDRLEEENRITGDAVSLLKQEAADHSSLTAGVLSVPGARYIYELALKAGLGNKIPLLVFGIVALFIVVTVLSAQILGAVGVAVGAAAAFFLPRFYLKRRIKNRNEAFINMFPDALDMIVRSVKSGFPLNTALRMISENTVEPIQSEFRQVVEEIAYGRTMTEALVRLGQRIDEPDLQFFIVVLSVQQEAGGNLAEVIGNLSGVIRKRKQLRLKIKALTSEGKATAWVLSALPVLVFIALWFISPQHLEPLFNTSTGHIVLGVAVGLIALSSWIVSQMIDIDI